MGEPRQVGLHKVRHHANAHEFVDARAGGFDQEAADQVQAFAQQHHAGDAGEPEGDGRKHPLAGHSLLVVVLHLIDEQAEQDRQRDGDETRQHHHAGRRSQGQLIPARDHPSDEPGRLSEQT